MAYRTLLICADCKTRLTVERQKAHIYYRCHTADCPGLSIREDRLTEQVLKRLKGLQVPPDAQAYLQERLHAWVDDTAPSDINKSVLLRIADASSRLDRLTDLLVDGTIKKPEYEVRKQNTEFELAQLREEEGRFADRQKNQADLDELLDMACSLKTMFGASTIDERRKLLKNCIERMEVCEGTVHLTAAVWLKELKTLSKDDDFGPTAEVFGPLRKTGKAVENWIS